MSIVPDPLLAEATDMANPNYTVLVRPYAFGQYRIQLTDKRQLDDDAPPPHGTIVRELCTYNHVMMRTTVAALAFVDDPEAYCESLAKPHNCEHPGGRIRLDSRPEEADDDRR